MTDQEADDVLAAATRLGVGAIDTAPLYGSGSSERRVGRALDSFATCAVSTKVDRRLLPPGTTGILDPAFVDADPGRYVYDYSRDGIRSSFSGSCARLGRDRVETLLLHDVRVRTHGHRAAEILDQAVAEALPAMDELKRERRCARIGGGVREVAAAEAVLDRYPIDVVLIASSVTTAPTSASVRLPIICSSKNCFRFICPSHPGAGL